MADAFTLELGSTDFTGVQEEMLSTSAPMVPNIHDANRKKIAIVIRPKESVSPRSIRTLSCFASASKNAETASMDVRPTTVEKPLPSTAAKLPRALPTRPRKTPTKPRAPPIKPRAMVASGRIEKPSRSPSPPRKLVPDLPMDAPSVVAANYELYTCGCATPSQCRQCTLRRLADKFCAIVAARKEKMRQNEAYAMHS